MSARWSVALHGGAGPIAGLSYTREEAHLASVLRDAAERLASGARALDVVEAAVMALEASGLYLAGRGAQPNLDGEFELDAAIMNGATRAGGAVGALQSFVHPVSAARYVMEHTPNVMLVGAGAARRLKASALARVDDPHAYYTPTREATAQTQLASGTVGAVALDQHGHLAAATSTAGISGKTPGRIGDTPILGAGTWADDTVAVSCTGLGEYFIRTQTAGDVSARMRYGGQNLGTATTGALNAVKSLGGEGGLIAVGRDGAVAMPWNSGGMKRASATSTGDIYVATFK